MIGFWVHRRFWINKIKHFKENNCSNLTVKISHILRVVNVLWSRIKYPFTQMSCLLGTFNRLVQNSLNIFKVLCQKMVYNRNTYFLKIIESSLKIRSKFVYYIPRKLYIWIKKANIETKFHPAIDAYIGRKYCKFLKQDKQVHNLNISFRLSTNPYPIHACSFSVIPCGFANLFLAFLLFLDTFSPLLAALDCSVFSASNQNPRGKQSIYLAKLITTVLIITEHFSWQPPNESPSSI